MKQFLKDLSKGLESIGNDLTLQLGAGVLNELYAAKLEIARAFTNEAAVFADNAAEVVPSPLEFEVAGHTDTPYDRAFFNKVAQGEIDEAYARVLAAATLTEGVDKTRLLAIATVLRHVAEDLE